MTNFNDLWAKLERQGASTRAQSISDLLADDPNRFASLRLEVGGLTADLSKNLISGKDISTLQALATECNLSSKIADLFRGEKVNSTEQREALHTLLRNPNPTQQHASYGRDVTNVLGRIRDLTQHIESGATPRITDVVNIGIGGSHLGPALVCDALRDFSDRGIQTHFISNVDGSMIDNTLKKLHPESTLFIVASKSFTTAETLLNALTAREWFQRSSNNSLDVAEHFFAVTAAVDKAVEFGISEKNVYPMWDWVGGRYSLWSAIGLAIALQYGYSRFESLLNGAAIMDTHFLESELHSNLPVLMGLVGLWHVNFIGSDTRAVVPYDDRLRLLPAYLQQLEMESNGKRVSADGKALSYNTSPVVWGGAGTDAQHAFFQLLHQGKVELPVDFIVCRRPAHNFQEHQDALFANCLAQAEALMCGDTASGEPSREIPGNHSSNMLVLDELTPETLGSLIALHEHRTFVQGVVWGINSFDQFGVELGKKLATSVVTEINAGEVGKHDRSTSELLRKYLEK